MNRRTATTHVPSNPLIYRITTGGTRCGIHGDDTTSGRCASCDKGGRNEAGSVRSDMLAYLMLALVPVSLGAWCVASLAGAVAGVA